MFARVSALVCGFFLFISSTQLSAFSLAENMRLVPAQGLSSSAKSLGLSFDEQTQYMQIDRALLGRKLLLLPQQIAEDRAEFELRLFYVKSCFFKLIGQKLYLLQDMTDQYAPGVSAPDSILEQFDVITSDERNITFDLLSGFQVVETTDSAPFGEGDGGLRHSYAAYFKAASSSDKLFSLQHVVRIFDETVTFTYAFMLDETDGYVGLVPDGYNGKRYINESPTVLNGSGEEKNYASRWDIRKPIQFFLTANTPAEYQRDIIEGVESWNKVFGRRLITVSLAPGDMDHTDQRYNFIQWVDWSELGLANASSQTHPQNGKILRAHVNFYSGWLSEASNLEHLLKLLRQPLAPKNNKLPRRTKVSLKNFTAQELRDENLLADSFRSLQKIYQSGEVSEKRLMELVHRLVRTVAMHEFGHILGLRHNFAGNLYSEMTEEENRRDLRALFSIGARSKPDLLPAASIMDYLPYEDDVRMDFPGSYDRAALQWLYLAKTEDERAAIKFPPFCTDENTDAEADCQRFDGGVDPVVWRQQQIHRELLPLQRGLLESLDGEDLFDYSSMAAIASAGADLAKLYLSEKFRIFDLETSADERKMSAAKTVADLLWSAGSAAPVNNLLLPEVKAQQNSPALIPNLVMLRDVILESVMSELGGECLLAEWHLQPMLVPALVELASNAGLKALFADENNHRLQAAKWLSRLRDMKLAQQSYAQLSKNIQQNIAQFEAQRNSGQIDLIQAEKAIGFERELLQAAAPQAAACND